MSGTCAQSRSLSWRERLARLRMWNACEATRNVHNFGMAPYKSLGESRFVRVVLL